MGRHSEVNLECMASALLGKKTSKHLKKILVQGKPSKEGISLKHPSVKATNPTLHATVSNHAHQPSIPMLL